MEFLTNLLDNTQYPVLAALILGLMMAISPCPLATNISAIGYISKDLQNRRRIFLNGLLYTLGRTISYTALGIFLILILNQGASIYKIQRTIGTYGEMFIGPLLILIGVFMMGWINVNFSMGRKMSEKAEAKAGTEASGAPCCWVWCLPSHSAPTAACSTSADSSQWPYHPLQEYCCWSSLPSLPVYPW
jgi:cytochrome c-type biogenesis protein